MCESNRIVMTIKTKNPKEQFKIGEQICNQLVGNTDFIDDNIIVNYTDDTNAVYVIIGNDAKETTLNLTL